MCQFFSCISDGKGKMYYCNWKVRSKWLSGNLPNMQSPDSHTSIAEYYGFKGSAEDNLNKYEYNPLTKVFVRDQINTTNDSDQIYNKIKRLKEPIN